ncbi:MAG: SAM-dependent methyltransferase [Rhodobacteraceae bacterium]|nr:SAM-dependent methyltransferase [Paracoccaceae bacterium]
MPASQPAAMVDRTALVRHRARARLDRAAFLHDEARFEIQERLAEVNRTFTAPAIVTAFPGFWGDFLPGATVVPDEDILPLQPGVHDLVIHAMALHWANDPVGQIVQCRRAMVADGLFLAVFLAEGTLSELRTALAEAEIALTGGLSPRVAPMGGLRDLGRLLQRAGLALPVADSSRRTATYPDLFALITDLRMMGETNALARRRVPATRDLFRRAAEIYQDSFPAGQGRIRASFDLIFLTGWSPHESQQKPLRRGSASTRLADALGTIGFGDSTTLAPGQ